MDELNGDSALALGAINAGVSLVTSYPGSPSSGTVQFLIDHKDQHGIDVEWSVNEKVAVEMAIGASIGGCRTLVCVKSVGMNVMVDPLMALNLTPLSAGMVILLGDDPGGYGSQNDQDTRPIIAMLEMPLLEPATPGEGYQMMVDAFELSEKFQVPVIIRETRKFSQHRQEVSTPGINYQRVNRGLSTETFRFVPVPENAVEKHLNLQARIASFQKEMESSRYISISGKGPLGIIATGYAHTKLIQTLEVRELTRVAVLKLGVLHPLPSKRIIDFLSSCDRILILEEGLPFLEIQIKAMAHDHSIEVDISGKQSNHIPAAGELFRWQIQKAILSLDPGYEPAIRYKPENEAEEYPKMSSNCYNCRYEEVLDCIDEVATELGLNALYVADPGCIFLVGDRLLAKYAIGSAVGLASGLTKAGLTQKVVALVGDSGFFHTTIPSIINAKYYQTGFLMVVLDNSAALTSGYQPTPAVGKDALGNPAPIVSIEEIAKSCGIDLIQSVNIDDKQKMREAILAALKKNELSLVRIEIPIDNH